MPAIKNHDFPMSSFLVVWIDVLTKRNFSFIPLSRNLSLLRAQRYPVPLFSPVRFSGFPLVCIGFFSSSQALRLCYRAFAFFLLCPPPSWSLHRQGPPSLTQNVRRIKVLVSSLVSRVSLFLVFSSRCSGGEKYRTYFLPKTLPLRPFSASITSQ